MGKKMEYTFLQRRYINGQWAYKKILSIISHQGSASQNYNEIYFIPSRVTERLHFHFHFPALEKEMATHLSVLAWRIPGTGEPGGLPSMGRTESDTTEAT